MKSSPNKPALRHIQEDSRVLTGEVFADIMKSVLAKGVPFRFMARGFSMTPFIRNEDIVTVRPPGEHPLETGDIVAFESVPGKLILHRIVEKNGTSLVLKGDNLTEGDGRIAEADVIGVVDKVERRGRSIAFGGGHGKVLISGISRTGRLIPVATRCVRAIRSLFRGRKS